MIQRQSVLTLCDQLLIESKLICDSVEKHYIIQKVANHIWDRVTEIKEICSVDKYDIFFNGKVEIGKSTAICTLFNLVDKDGFMENKKPSDALLLKTAPGRTTVCETVITQVEGTISKVTVEPVSADEFSVMVREYVKAISPKRNAETDSAPSVEVSRAIKNMIQIPSEFTSNEDKFEYILEKFASNSKTIDQNDLLNLLTSGILKYINYESRTQTEYFNEENDFSQWMKKIFDDINDGRLENCPLPNKIYIDLCRKDVEMNLPSFVNRVIDTRGIDVGERKDIQDAMKKKDSISLMHDRIGGFGGEVTLLNILEQVLIKENNDLKNRVYLVGLERDCQLTEESEAEGEKSRGEKIKRQQAIDTINRVGINFNTNNIVFYNSFHGIETSSSSKKIIKIDSTQYIQEKKKFFGLIENGLKNMYSEYLKELMDLLEKIHLLEKDSITDEILVKLNQCKDVVSEKRGATKSRIYDLLADLEKEILGTNPSIVRASVNRLGNYYNFNLYETIQKLGGEEFKSKCFEMKTEMVGYIKGIFGTTDGIEDVILQSILSLIDSEYYNYYEKSRSLYYENSKAELCNEQTWKKPLQYWGDGEKNYRFRVAMDLLRETKDKRVHESLSNVMIFDSFYDGLIKFMDFKQPVLDER
ncbi:hypothetical protein NYE70_22180 [Paenibacillus sp. FSL R5-0407]|uniref:hypothetical protein n=1 Tax=Paenibacillus sp. FSL R5-0407 TaxID=2975320 RepID=UPI0030F762D9